MAKLDGSKIVVIGGASGVGFAVASAALEAGAEVVVGSSQAPRIQAAAEKLGRGAKGQTVDVKDEASVAAFFEAAGPFDHLIFTAGDWGHMFGPTRDLDVEASKARMEVRFWGAARAAKHAIRQIDKDGSITLTGGMLAHRPMPGAPLTTASAHTTEGLAMGLARDLAPIRVNAPGPDPERAGPDHGRARDQGLYRQPAAAARRNRRGSGRGLPVPDARHLCDRPSCAGRRRRQLGLSALRYLPLSRSARADRWGPLRVQAV